MMSRARSAAALALAMLASRTAWADEAPTPMTPPVEPGPRALETPEEPPLPCRGDACAHVPPENRRPLLVAVGAPPATPPPPRRHQSRDSAGPRISFGRLFSPSIANGWYGRFDAELFEVFRPGMLSMRIGGEGWGSKDGGGGGFPWSLEGGAAVPFTKGPKSPRFVIAGGLGLEIAYYDRTKHTGQFGIFAPMADAYVGIDLRGVRLFGEGSAQYRWGWGDADRAQYRVGASLSLSSELWDGPTD